MHFTISDAQYISLSYFSISETYFSLSYFSDHQNWFGIDENLGPVAVSIRRERVPISPEMGGHNNQLTHVQPHMNQSEHWMYRYMDTNE